MYLLYLDESGNENDPKDRFFVLGGLSVFERQAYFLSQELDRIQERHFPGKPPIPFHASEIRAGRDFWRTISKDQREQILRDVVAAIRKSPDRSRFLYAAAIEKSNVLYGDEAVERATEQVCQRFDIFLTRQFQENNDPQRGLLVFSEGRFDARAKIWVRGFHQHGTTWGTINNLADIPYFASSRESRLLQLADFVAHGVWLLYERRDSSLVGDLMDKFDSHEGVLHGLVHIRPSAVAACGCPACASRGRPGDLGPWLQ